MVHSVYISIGTNQGNKVNNCNLAIKKLRDISEISKISSFYKTSSWGFDDDFFINFVVQINTIFSPEILLQKLLFIENQMGRVRIGNEYSSRVIDFDILFFDDVIIKQSNLVIPHPQLYLRKFVLIPLLEIAPNFICPHKKMSISKLLKKCSDKNSVEKLLY